MIVVPMLAPNMTVAACAKVMMPALTKPITMTVVALELCIAAVVTAPTPTPSLLFEVFANSLFRRLLPSDSRFELIIVQAMRKMPTPAARESTDVAICTASINNSFFIPFGRDICEKKRKTLTERAVR